MQWVVALLIRMVGNKATRNIILKKLSEKSPFFAKVLKNSESIDKVMGNINNALKYIDPQFLFDTLMQLPKSEIQKYLKMAVDNKKMDYRQAKKFEQMFQGDLKDQKSSFNEAYQEYMSGGNQAGWVNLSSSWIQRGMYMQNGASNNGTMTIFIRSDKDPMSKIYGPYTYPNIPVEVWNAMKMAKGKNGSGAGKVFWNMWLRKWLNSYLRDHTYNKLRKEYSPLNSQTYKRLPNQGQVSQLIREQQELVRQATSSYYRTTAAKRAKLGYPSSPSGKITPNAWTQAKPFSSIDNPTYMTHRKQVQKDQYKTLRAPISQTQENLKQAREARVQARAAVVNAKNNLNNFNNLNRVVRITKSTAQGNLKPLKNATYKAVNKQQKNKWK